MSINDSINDISNYIDTQHKDFLPRTTSRIVRAAILNNVISNELTYDAISDEVFELLLSEALSQKYCYLDNNFGSLISRMIYDMRETSAEAL